MEKVDKDFKASLYIVSRSKRALKGGGNDKKHYRLN